MSDGQCIRESELAQARGAAYGLMAYGFQYPDHDTFSTLADPKRWDRWPEVLHDVYGQVSSSLQSVRDAVTAAACFSDAKVQELQQHYDGLFGHAVRGQCPAYEMEYNRNEIIRLASDLADLAGFYRAFGLEIANGAEGRPDHITAECEFMSVLCSKEAYAHAQDDQPNADICLDAERAFLRDHLARWLPAFSHRVAAADPDGWLAASARFAATFLKAECGRFDIHPGPPTLELRVPDPVLDTGISCPPAGSGACRPSEQVVQLGLDRVDGKHR